MTSKKLIRSLITILIMLSFCICSCGSKKGGSDDVTGLGDSITGPVEDPSPKEAVYVDGENGKYIGTGSQDDPVNSITLGLVMAREQGKTLCVAQGIYEVDSSYDTHLVMQEGVSILGGYLNNNGEWTRDPSKYITTIQDTVYQDQDDDSIRAAIECSNISNATVINGLVIIGGNNGKKTAAILCDGGAPVISNCNIIAGNGEEAYGVYCSKSNATITDNQISGGNGVKIGVSVAIYCQYSNALISKNIINGGDGRMFESNGINCSYSNPLISDNTIDGGNADDAIAIKCYGSSQPIIENNTLKSSGRIQRYGIFETLNGDNPVSVKGNVFYASIYKSGSSGFYHDSSSTGAVSDSDSNIYTISALNNMDDSGLNASGSVDNNSIYQDL